MLWKILYWLTACALFMILAVDHAQAAIIISEVAPAPTAGPEWVELYNSGPEVVDLTEWYLEDHLASPARIFDFAHDVSQPDKWLLSPNAFFVVSLSSAKLNNSGDGVTLFNSEYQLVASMSYSGSTPGKTWSLTASDFENYFETDPNPFHFASPLPSPSPSPSPTPTTTPPPTPSPTPSPASQNLDSSTISLTSYHPCPPSGEKEWLSLNYTGPALHTFNDWIITDESGNTRTLAGTLVPNQKTKLDWSGALLNNSGDSFAVHTAQSELIASAAYQTCTGEIFTTHVPDSVATSSATVSGNSFDSPSSNSQSDTKLPRTLSKSTFARDYQKYSAHLTPPTTDSYSLTQDDLTTSYEKIWIKREPSLLGIQSVILGGSLLLASAAILLYQPTQNRKKTLPALYVETLT